MGSLIEMKPVSRRDVIKFGSAGVIVGINVALLPGLAAADAKAVEAEIAKIVGGKKIVT